MLLLALLIFVLRIVDVSLGTLRTLSVVQGHVRASMMYGFAEVLVWSFAVTRVFVGPSPTPLLISWAAGYAAGNAVGIMLERRFARRRVVYTLLTSNPDGVYKACAEIDPQLRLRQGNDVVYITGCKTYAHRIVTAARGVDAECTCIVEDEL